MTCGYIYIHDSAVILYERLGTFLGAFKVALGSRRYRLSGPARLFRGVLTSDPISGREMHLCTPCDHGSVGLYPLP